MTSQNVDGRAGRDDEDAGGLVRVEHLSKRYTIRHQRGPDDGLRHAIHDLAMAPMRWLRAKRQAQSTSEYRESTRGKDLSQGES